MLKQSQKQLKKNQNKKAFAKNLEYNIMESKM